jgi:hypothetical protein
MDQNDCSASFLPVTLCCCILPVFCPLLFAFVYLYVCGVAQTVAAQLPRHQAPSMPRAQQPHTATLSHTSPHIISVPEAQDTARSRTQQSTLDTWAAWQPLKRTLASADWDLNSLGDSAQCQCKRENNRDSQVLESPWCQTRPGNTAISNHQRGTY